MKLHPKFSIVTPSFNQSKWLGQAIASVVDQGYPEVELIVMDGGSNDGSKTILRERASQIAYWQSGPDGGQTAALNTGITRVTGEITGWINSDDYYLPGAFEIVANRFKEADRPDLVFGYSINVDADSNILRENRHDDFSVQRLLVGGMDLRQQAMFWRSELNARVFPLDESLQFCMDLQLVIRLAAMGARFVRVPEYLGAFRIHGDAKTATIPEVCAREYDQLIRFATDTFGPTRMSRSAMLLYRRLNFCRRGEWKYGLFGGTRWLPHRLCDAAKKAQSWSNPELP